MANNYYDFTVPFVPGTKVRSDDVNNELSGVTAGFDKLPTDPESINTGTMFLGTESGTGNAYVVARDNPQTSYVDGHHVGFFATHSNTSNCTLNVDAIGVVALVAPDGSALVANDVLDGVFYEAVFDSTNNHWQMMTPMAGTLANGDLRVDWAEEWANKAEDSLVSTAAGGDGVDDYSSLHWSIKSSDSAAAALVSENAAADSYDQFDDRYLGSKASDPALDNDGGALLTGALYWNSTNSVMRVYNGAAWEDVGTSSANVTTYTSTAAQTTYTGLDDNGVLLAYQPGFLFVYLNGVLLEGGGADYTASTGNTIVLVVAANSGDILQSLGFGTFDVADGKSNQIVKTSNETKSADDTYAADSELVLNGMAASSEYIVEGMLILTTRAAPDFKFRIGGNGTFVAAGGTYNAMLNSANNGFDTVSNNLAFEALTGVVVTTDNASASLFLISFKASIETNSATSIQLEWAQNASTEVDTIVHLDSYLRATKV